MEKKAWYTSKTLWVNGITVLLSILVGVTGGTVLGFDLADPSTTAAVTTGALAVANFILRIATKTGIQ